MYVAQRGCSPLFLCSGALLEGYKDGHMPRLSNRLTTVVLRALPIGKHLDGEGLYLIKTDSGIGRWMLRFRRFGRRRDMGLGANAVSSPLMMPTRPA